MHPSNSTSISFLELGILLFANLSVIAIILKLRRNRTLSYYWDEYWEAVMDRNEEEAQRLAEKYYSLLNNRIGLLKGKVSRENQQMIERHIASYKKRTD